MLKIDLIEILQNILDDGKYSNIELNNLFSQKQYNMKERAFIKNLLNATLKNLIYIDYIISKYAKKISKKKIKNLLRISVAQIEFMDSDNKGVIFEANEIAKKVNIHQSKFVNYVLNQIVKYDKSDIPEDIRYSCPRWLYLKLKKEWDDKYIDFLKSIKNQSYLCIRYNSNKITKQRFEEKLKECKTDILFNIDEFYYINNYNPLEKNIFGKDEIIIQDLASYVVTSNMNVEDDDIVLDACASPGGKSFGILSQYNPKKLYSTDIYDFKIERLEQLKSIYNFDNMIVEKKDATNPQNYETKYFDKILLDVPCSGLGVLKRKPEKIYSLTQKNIDELVQLQRKIFENNLEFLKDDGYIVYSTCTITKQENTENIRYFMQKYNLESVKLNIPDNIKYINDEYNGVYLSFENKYIDNFYIIKLKKVNNENKTK